MSEGEATFQEGAASVFAARRTRVLERLAGDAMILPAAPTLYRSRDSELPYRPDSELFYLTGFTEPRSLLLLRGFADEQRSVLFVRPRDAKAERWTGPRLGPSRARERYGVDGAYPIDELPQRLPTLLAGARRIHFRLGLHREAEQLVVKALHAARMRGPRKGTGPRAVVDPGEILDELRLRKGPEELEAIRAAVAATVAGFRAGMAVAEPGRGEWEVQAEVEAEFRRRGASGPAFATIVGSGENACVLHYVENGARLGENELVLLDAGAEVGMYAGDVTRTFPVSGRFTPVQRAVYEVVERARRAAVGQVRPGSTVQEVHRAAVEILAEGLIELGVLGGDVDEVVEKEAYKRYFPHQTAHWLGLDTHDPGDYVREGEPRRLEAGMVLTIEPGLYFASVPEGEEGEEGEENAEAADHGERQPGRDAGVRDHPYRGIGVRIEDDVLVTADGAEVLTRELPTDPDRVAEMVGSRRT